MRYLFFLPFLALFTACGGGEEALPEVPVRAVRYGEVFPDDGSTSQSYTGVATAAGETPLSFRVGGTIRELRVKLGDRVTRGQLIATLDPADLQVQSSQSRAQYEASEANVKSAETQLVAARAAYDRMLKLYESNSISLSDFEQARSQFQSAQAQLEASKSQLDASGSQVRAARNQVSYTRLTAPFTGIITMLNVERNEFVGSGKAIVHLSTEEDPEVEVNLPESRIGAISQGMKVDITFPALSGQTYEGTVTEVAYAAGDAPSYPVTVRIEKAGKTVRPGMAANVRFTFGEDSNARALILTPIESVTEGPEGKFVYLLTPGEHGNYVANKTKVTIGDLHEKGFEVTSGLKAGDKVATAGLKSLLDGMEVRLLD
ncbi:efflux RND transporter periplasmic adaptor subunit [Neolewinella aurantiaca]|uniref:Efflux RND transporter periplasmic adaptor subunit n=1 Tax=Neolewinella aurantiaca TaxID=2602767 RepID=A0A5C7FLW9_9BACT|nr:efflux RND transporter periplasmic adaptor subunit [Neolewinella aurantiaca]TXF91021.1 efflux RND transporter periplasmic adaptor subunit [Neolewinella aurantiaca]